MNNDKMRLNDLTFNIRPIERDDNAIIASIIRKTIEDIAAPRKGTVYDDPRTDNLYESFANKTDAQYWIVSENGCIIGGCGFYPTESLPSNCAEIVKFYLSSQAQGKGIGRKLLSFIEKQAVNSGYTELYLETFKESERAITLYEQYGYKFLDHALGNSGHPGAPVYMIKQLIE